jgi:hypothetical protein
MHSHTCCTQVNHMYTLRYAQRKDFKLLAELLQTFPPALGAVASNHHCLESLGTTLIDRLGTLL